LPNHIHSEKGLSGYPLANAVALPGVTVGSRVVIAAGAVVNKDVPSDCLVAGVPAKIVKRLPLHI